MRISICIVTWNQEKLLKKCLESLTKQTEKVDEVVLVDNNSTDNTKKIVLGFKKKLPIKYFLEKKLGIPYARNMAVKKSNCPMIAFLDNDCIADEKWIENIRKTIIEHPQIKAFASLTLCANPKNLVTRTGQFMREYNIKSQSITNSFFERVWGYLFTQSINKRHFIFNSPTENLIVKKSVFKQIGLFDEDMIPTGEDSEFSWRMKRANIKILFDPRIKVKHHHREKLKEFYLQHFYYGTGVPKIKKKWPDFPSRIPNNLQNWIIFSSGFIILPIFKILQIRNPKDIAIIHLLIINEISYKFGMIAGMKEHSKK